MLSLIASLGLLSPAAHAQSAYNAHGFTLTPGGTSITDLLTVWGAERQNQGECGLEGLFEYASTPLILTLEYTDGRKVDELWIKDMAGVNVGATCGISDRLGLAASTPVWFTTSSDESREGLALGDTRLSAPIGLVLPGEDGQGLGVAVVPFISVPTANLGGGTERYLGSGGFGGGADLAVGYTGERLAITANGGVEQTPEAVLENLRGGTFLRAGLGGSVKVSEDVALRLEGTAQTTAAPDIEPWMESPVQVLASARGMTDSDLVWTVGGAMGVTQGAGAANYRVFAGLGKAWGRADAAPTPEPEPVLTHLRIVALDPDGNPVNAEVAFLDAPSPEDDQKLGDDGVTLLNVDPGDFRMRLSYGDYEARLANARVPEGRTTTVTVQFNDAGPGSLPVDPCRETLTLNSVHFEFDDDRPTADSIPTLIDVGLALAQCPEVPVIVGGHTDAAGDALYNLDLSQRRMNSVVDILVSAGVARDRLTPVGFGESKLKVEVPTEEACRVPGSEQAPEIVNNPTGRCAMNRRVEFQPVTPRIATR